MPINNNNNTYLQNNQHKVSSFNLTIAFPVYHNAKINVHPLKDNTLLVMTAQDINIIGFALLGKMEKVST